MSSNPSKVLILGYGAREHALAWKINQSQLVDHVFVAPGNAGTAAIATNVNISDEDVPALVAFALDNHIDLTVVGTNDPLALGVVDAFQDAGLAIFGPTQQAAMLESSKAFSKQFMIDHGIPTPDFATFTDALSALSYLDSLTVEQVVVKIDGLGMMGMGVTVCDSIGQAKAAVTDYLVNRSLGESGSTIIIEEYVTGPEVSMFAFSDGETAVPLLPVRDHKRVNDGNTGPNTGGMGAFGPPADCGDDFVRTVTESVLQPVITGMAEQGTPYVGVLFAGLMLTDRGVEVLEFNCRFGNPEASVLMTLLKSDLVPIMLACIDGTLSEGLVEVDSGTAASVVISSGGYPAREFPLGLPIYKFNAIKDEDCVQIFHHGTEKQDGATVTSRGRVLAVTAVGSDLRTARKRAYRGVSEIWFKGAHFRSDIGRSSTAP